MKLKSCGLASFAVAGMVYTSLSLVSKAEAFTITSTDSFTNQLLELEGDPVLTLNKFSTPLGSNEAVTRVDVTIAAVLTTSGTLINIGTSPRTFTLRFASEQFDVNPQDGSPAPLTTLTPFTFRQLIGQQTYTNLLPGPPSTFGPSTISGSDTETFTSIGDIAAFLGAGTFSFDPFTAIRTTFSGGSADIYTTNIKTFADVTATVTYTVEVVPFEFSPVLGVGLLGGLYGLNQLRKNRNKKVNSVK
jgi:hypothetical protein